MQLCVQRGIQQQGVLPGGLNVRRRAARLHDSLLKQIGSPGWNAMEWVNLYALAVNGENAAGGRVVTALTNGRRALFRRYCIITCSFARNSAHRHPPPKCRNFC